jgi:DNA-directed RNA polymerase specialized sigma24 family protein
MTGLASPASSTATASWVAAAVQSAVAGDEMAFARIVDAYHRDLVRVAYVVAGDEQLAEDAAQSAWSIAWRAAPMSFFPRPTSSSWRRQSA